MVDRLEYDTNRVLLDIRLHSLRSGKLEMDFDPAAYGERGRGFFTGPLPGVRLMIPRGTAGAPDVAVEVRPPILGGPWRGSTRMRSATSSLIGSVWMPHRCSKA
jgi:hypothetical protein